MEENKYYTPEIEEFHVGFEYEYLTNGDDWVKHTINDRADLTTCIEELEDGLIRVKYLDQEDIESLGETVYKDGKIYFSNNELPPLAITFSRDDSSIIIEGIISKCVLFIGKIKNKSELKRILKQIGV